MWPVPSLAESMTGAVGLQLLMLTLGFLGYCSRQNSTEGSLAAPPELPVEYAGSFGHLEQATD